MMADPMSSDSPALRHVRAATPADVEEIVAMIRELAEYEREPEAATATVDQLHEVLFSEHPLVHCLIGEVDALVAGFALWFVNFSTWQGRHGMYLEDLFVRPQFRRSGLGRLLLSTLAREAVDRDFGRLEWSVLDWNTMAIDFYTSIGAEPLDEWTKYRLSDQALTALSRTNLA